MHMLLGLLIAATMLTSAQAPSIAPSFTPSARVEFRLGSEQPQRGLIPFPGIGELKTVYLRRDVALSNAGIASAAGTSDEFGRPAIHFTLTEDGARKLRAVMSRNVHKMLAVLVDGRVVLTAIISAPIENNETQITGLSREEVDRVVATFARR